MNLTLRVRLSVMMFLQFFIWGGWYATAGNYMASRGMSDAIYWAYLVSPIGSILSPFFLGMVADRFFAVQKVMGVLHVLSGVFVLCAPLAAERSSPSTPLFLLLLLLHMLCYMPTLGLATSMAFHCLPGRERQFPLIRVFGTIGWIAAGFTVSFLLQGDTAALPMYVAGAAGILMGVYSFTLPNIAPPAAGRNVSIRDVLGLDALALLSTRPFIVFLVCLMLTSIPLATYYAYVPVFLRTAGISSPAFKMTFGQMSEVVFLLLLPLFLARMGIKRVLVVGMTAWVARYGLFAAGAPDPVVWMLIIGILLHGVCYDFVYIAGQVYIDTKATRAIRSQAQGLFVLVSYGVGQGLGTLVAGGIFNTIMTGDARQDLLQWRAFWLAPMMFAALVMLAFVLLFREEGAKAGAVAPAG